MLITREDPRRTWRALGELETLTAAQAAELRALPSGAREAPLDWLATTRQDVRGYFDKDAQDTVTYEQTVLTGWRDAPDPRVARAGALSLLHVDVVFNGEWSGFPGTDRLGPAMSALSLPGAALHPSALAWIGERHPWVDLSIHAGRWPPVARKAGLRELAAGWGALRGLELHAADLDAEDLGVLAGAPFTPRLEDLTLNGRLLHAGAMRKLAGRLGALRHLDLRDARLGAKVFAALAPKLRGSRRLQLAGNPLGDAGLATLLAAGALDRVEDLWLSRCGLTTAGARALAAAPLPRLRGLWLDGNPLGDPGLAALLDGGLLDRLDGASLYDAGLSDRARARLAGHPLEGALSGTARRPGVLALWFLGRPDTDATKVA